MSAPRAAAQLFRIAGATRSFVPPATTRAGTAQRAVPTIALTVLYRSQDGHMSRVFINRSQLVGLRRSFVVQIRRRRHSVGGTDRLVRRSWSQGTTSKPWGLSMNHGWFGVPPLVGSTRFDRLKPELQTDAAENS